MKVKPYVLGSVRNTQAWNEIADLLNLHVVIVREAYMARWCAPVQARDFIDLVKRGEITREEVVEAADCFMEFPLEELDRREAASLELSQENDFSDRLDYKLKQIIEVVELVFERLLQLDDQFDVGRTPEVIELRRGRECSEGVLLFREQHFAVLHLARKAVNQWRIAAHGDDLIVALVVVPDPQFTHFDLRNVDHCVVVRLRI